MAEVKDSTKGRKDGWMDGWTDGRMDGWMDGWREGGREGGRDSQIEGWGFPIREAAQAKEASQVQARPPHLHSTRGLSPHTVYTKAGGNKLLSCLAACHLHQSRQSGGTTPAET